jgi:hypothetical protein
MFRVEEEQPEGPKLHDKPRIVQDARQHRSIRPWDSISTLLPISIPHPSRKLNFERYPREGTRRCNSQMEENNIIRA